MSEPMVFTDPAGLAALVPAWRRLALDEPGTSFFISPDWILPWWETFGARSAGEVAIWGDVSGRLEAVVPLVATRARIHPRLPVTTNFLTLLGTGTGSADHCGPLTRPEQQDAVRAWLARRAARHTLLLPNLDTSSEGLVPSGARLLDRVPCPRVDLSEHPDLPTGSAKLRKQVRRYERRLADAGVTLRWVPPGKVTAEILDALFRLHQDRMAHGARETSFGADRQPFQMRVLEAAHDGFGPAAVVAEHNGTIVGVLYGFRWRDEFAYYQTGWDPALADLDLGTVLVATAMRECRSEGVRIFDFLRGAEPYKYRFGAVDRIDSTWLLPRGVSGWTVTAKLTVKRQLARRSRRGSRRQPAAN